jgi:hypothetical protein
MDFKILRIDNENKKIGLSARSVGKDEPIVDAKVYSSQVGSGMASLGELAGLAKAVEPEPKPEPKSVAEATKPVPEPVSEPETTAATEEAAEPNTAPADEPAPDVQAAPESNTAPEADAAETEAKSAKKAE